MNRLPIPVQDAPGYHGALWNPEIDSEAHPARVRERDLGALVLSFFSTETEYWPGATPFSEYPPYPSV